LAGVIYSKSRVVSPAGKPVGKSCTVILLGVLPVCGNTDTQPCPGGLVVTNALNGIWVALSLAVSGTLTLNWLLELVLLVTADTPMSITAVFTTVTVTGMVTDVVEFTALTVIVPLQTCGVLTPFIVAVTTMVAPFTPTLGEVLALAGDTQGRCRSSMRWRRY